eukprot:CAMPEP_0195247446 /NCGR_PEP_ID=MMETSP0706-20130129/977_1 /TAXON_ID=33640 /ORGANISM="Asterionellopsis glacialis, Strain CCMP134" /LENGTH=135 /DNA_ID=CAMNT_0040298963 /DNA_START=526 /DNA_END=933 /DNA_ORIENTATION=+
MNENLIFNIDHLHPSSVFEKSKLEKFEFLNKNSEKMEFYADKTNWNSVLNLHLLSESQNKSKQDKCLVDWVDNVGLSHTDLLLNKRESLEFSMFQKFVEDRREVLLKRLKANVVLSVENDEDFEVTLDDEQVTLG